jgi:hypothetical protein
VRPKFHIGDVVKVVHHFDHFLRPSPEADGEMSGNLRAVISKVSRSTDNCEPNSYAIVWLGKGTHVRVLCSLLSGPSVSVYEHHRGCAMSWWDESCLQLVQRRPKISAELRLVLKTELGD